MVTHVTRIAPSPTGLFHLGTARTALFNWLVAKASGGKFIVRIDDTDMARNSTEAIDVIDQSLAWLGLNHDIRFSQSNRLNDYQLVAEMMLERGLAYRMNDDDDKTVRLRMAAIDVPLMWQDTIAGNISITDHDRRSIDGLVLLRSDGFPTYHFASVIDDMNCNVTWVIRGHDHLSNTPKHVALWRALTEIIGPKPQPLWSHVGLLMLDKKKLSKRDGAASVLSYRDQGIDSDAMVNWLLRMGWGPNVDDKSTATISRERAIEMFLNDGKMRSAPSSMNIQLLQALDRKYKAKKIKGE